MQPGLENWERIHIPALFINVFLLCKHLDLYTLDFSLFAPSLKAVKEAEDKEISLRDEKCGDAYDCLLDDYERLDAIGAVIEVDGTIVAFAFGEPLNTDTFVIHFEKADTDYVGAYQMINKLFVSEYVLPCYAFVNREQDLGHEGIRRAKMSYIPDRLIAKYILKI